MKRALLLLTLLLLPVLTWGQSVTVTGTIQTSSGAVATNGYVEFDLSPFNSAILYTIPASTVVVPQKGQCAINASGQVVQQDPVTKLPTANPCKVWGNDLIVPANTLYTVKIAPNNSVQNTIQNVLIAGSSASLQAPVIVMNPQPVIGTQISATPLGVMSVVPVVNNVWSLGDPLHYFLNLYVTNLNFVNQQLLNGWSGLETATPILPNPNFENAWFKAGVGICSINSAGTIFCAVPLQHLANTVWGNNTGGTAPDADVKVTFSMTDGATIAPTASPTFTGVPVAPTAAAGDNSTQIATDAYVKSQNYVTALTAPVTSVAGKTGAVTLVEADIASLVSDLGLKAPLASPAFTGTPTVPTAAANTNTTQAASTAFVITQIPATNGFSKLQSLIATTGLCTTAATSHATCTTSSLPWPASFADTSYSVHCQGVGTITGVPAIEGVSKSVSGVVVTIVNSTADGAVASTWSEVDCIAVHP